MISRRLRRRGFTLVELLVVVAIIGILSGIAISIYSVTLNRARQKRTAADIRLIATAWEARAADEHSYLIAGYSFPTAAVTFDDLAGSLTPTYTRRLPDVDGWGNALEFGAGPDKSVYGIRSRGRDGVFEGDTYTPGETSDPDCDIVFGDGVFIQYPGVAQQGDDQ